MQSSASDLRSRMARVRGLGSAKDGTHHWWLQRVTAIALIPLTLWFVGTLIAATGSGHPEAVALIGHPVTATLLILAIIAGFIHAALGMQVIYEDYVHSHCWRITLDLLTRFGLFALGAGAVLAVVRISLA